MGLPARQRRALDHIDRVLRGSDPRLGALYAIFGRLTREEPMPRFEQLRSGLLTRLALLGVIFAAIGSHLRIRRRRRLRLRIRPRQRAILLYPLAIALTIGSIVLAARSGPDKGCLPVRAVAAAKNVAKTSLCRPPGSLSPVMFGH
ncbi:MAG TPA: hypothetical protein VEV45_09850 [Streptosporangiaceae bacterium]|nr:hypothetical protein [Streptosporangiaceae bacterium]